MKNKIRIAFIGNKTILDNWIFYMLKDIVGNPQIEVVNFFVIPIPEPEYPFSYRLYDLFEKRVFKFKFDAFEKKDVHKLIPSNKISTIHKQHYFTKIKHSLKNKNIDFIVNLDCNISMHSLENFVNVGVLFFYHGALNAPISHIAGLREILNSQDFIETHLMMLSKESHLKTLKTTKAGTDNVSIRGSVNDLLWTASRLLPRELDRFILNSTFKYVQPNKISDVLNFKNQSNIWKPNNLFILKGLFKKYFKKIQSYITFKFYFEQWILMFISKPYNVLKGHSPNNFNKILPPKDRFWADPFIYNKNNQNYVFFEELIYKENKGHISVITLQDNGTYTQPQCILKKKYHLSYPFLIEDKGELFMIPETFENNTIEIYRCINFPYQWEFAMNLMNNIVAVDTTILKRNNRFWMFTNIQERKGASMNNELFIFYSDNLLSQNWHPHKENPVISDVTKARSAGNIFEYENEFYRPAQNCGKHYGYSFSINKIVTLTEEDYKEHEVSNTLPNWDKNILSTHTFNQFNELALIDAVMKIKK